MFIIYLKLSADTSRAPEFLSAHNEWIAQGIEDGAFLVVGSLVPQGGGAILAHGEDRSRVEARIMADPFVREGIAIPEIQEVIPGRADDRLAFLLDAPRTAGT